MSGRIVSCLVAFLLAAAWPGTPSHAQGIYRTPGANGPVFSDKPQPGSREVALPPLNVVEPVRPAPAPAPAKGVDGPSVRELAGRDGRPVREAYQRLVVVFPEDGGSLIVNAPILDVRVAVEPALRVGDGDGFVVSVNGRSLPQRYTATEFTVAADFLGDVWAISGQTLQLDVALVDASGATLVRAAPVRFALRAGGTVYPPNRVWPRPPLPPHPPRPPVQPPQPPQPAAPTAGSSVLRSKGDGRRATETVPAQ